MKMKVLKNEVLQTGFTVTADGELLDEYFSDINDATNTAKEMIKGEEAEQVDIHSITYVKSYVQEDSKYTNDVTGKFYDDLDDDDGYDDGYIPF